MASMSCPSCIRPATPVFGVFRSTLPAVTLQKYHRGRLVVAAKAGIFQKAHDKAENAERKVAHAVEDHTPNPPHVHMPHWMPSLSNIVIFGAVAYGLSQTVFKKAPKDKNPVDKVKETAQNAAEKTPKPPQVLKPRPIDAARAVLAVASVSPEESGRLFATADANSDGKVDLRELTRAIKKLQPPRVSFEEARNAAVDAFVLFGADGTKGMNEEQFRRWLQSWCLLKERNLKDAVFGMERALQLPDAKMAPEDKAVSDELDAAMRSQESARRYWDAHKTGAAFSMWDHDRNGSIGRDKVNKALLRYAADELQHKSPANKVLQAVSIVELDQKLGPGSLDRLAFDNLLRRFAEAVGVEPGQVSDYLIEVAMRKEEGTGPDPDDVMDDMKRMKGLHSDSAHQHNGQHRSGGEQSTAQQRGGGGRDSVAAAERRPQGQDGRAGKY